MAVWTTLQSHLKQTGEYSRESLRCLTAGLKVEGKYLGIKMSSRLLAVVQEYKFDASPGLCMNHSSFAANSHYFAMITSVFLSIVRPWSKCQVIVN